jgi:gliding motility-associated protein GldC
VIKNRIVLEVELDDEKMPEKISWDAGNPEDEGFKQSKAFFLTLFDKTNRDTLELDLWTKEMQVIEMDRFVFQTLNSLSEMYFRATKNTDLANEMKSFARYFGEKTNIVTI